MCCCPLGTYIAVPLEDFPDFALDFSEKTKTKRRTRANSLDAQGSEADKIPAEESVKP